MKFPPKRYLLIEAVDQGSDGGRETKGSCGGALAGARRLAAAGGGAGRWSSPGSAHEPRKSPQLGSKERGD